MSPLNINARASFIEHFGEEQAAAIEAAAASHEGETITKLIGTDRFVCCLLRCIDFECVSREEFREHHGITAPLEALQRWSRKEQILSHFKGDIPVFSLFAGAFNPWIDEAKKEG